MQFITKLKSGRNNMKKYWIFWIILSGSILLHLIFASVALQYRENTDVLRYRDWARISYLFSVADTYSTKHLMFGTLPNNQPPGSAYIIYVSYMSHILFTRLVLRIVPHSQALFAWINGPSINFALRLPAMIADCLVGFFIWKYFRNKAGYRYILVLLLVLLNPVFLFNSAFMGQMDALNNFIFVCSLFCLINKKYYSATLLLAVSLLIKLSLIFVVPFFFYFLYISSGDFKKTFKSLIVFCITFILAALPLSSNPASWYAVFLKTSATGEMSNITAFAFNLWWVIFHPWIKIGNPSSLFSFSEIQLIGSPDTTKLFFNIPLGLLAYGLFFVCLIPIILVLLRKRKKILLPENIFLIFGIISLIAYITLPKMHDRYIYPPLLLFAIAAGFRPKILLPLIFLCILNMINLYIVWHPLVIPFVSYMFMNSRLIQWCISVGTVLTSVFVCWFGYNSMNSL